MHSTEDPSPESSSSFLQLKEPAILDPSFHGMLVNTVFIAVDDRYIYIYIYIYISCITLRTLNYGN